MQTATFLQLCPEHPQCHERCDGLEPGPASHARGGQGVPRLRAIDAGNLQQSSRFLYHNPLQIELSLPEQCQLQPASPEKSNKHEVVLESFFRPILQVTSQREFFKRKGATPWLGALYTFQNFKAIPSTGADIITLNHYRTFYIGEIQMPQHAFPTLFLYFH